MGHMRTVILGGGAAGLSLANRLRRLRHEGEIILIERGEHLFQAGLTALIFGDRQVEEIRRPLEGLLLPEIEWIRGEVEAIEPSAQRVRTRLGVVEYDELVIALGVLPESPQPLPEGYFNPWTLEGALALRQLLPQLGSAHRLAVIVAGVPYRCPPAPFDLSVRLKWTTGAQVHLFHPWPRPLAPLGPVGEQLAGWVRRYGVEIHNGIQIDRLEQGRLRTAGGEEFTFDYALLIPPHRPPALLAEAGLAEPGAFLPVSYPSLRHPRYPQIYGLGDIIAPPLNLGMAGTLALQEASSLALRLARGEERPIEPTALCFLDFGFAGSQMACDFQPALEGQGPPRCLLLPAWPYFRRARGLFLEEWFAQLLQGVESSAQ
jgi:sulfide:quinone oxidoreductase